jgi:predicted NAD/FAD-binding protein
VWSADPAGFLDMPARTFARFFDNHGLLRLGAGKDWRTVDGGSARYVEAITARLGPRLRLGTGVATVTRHADRVEVTTIAGGREDFDHVVLATHSDQALGLLTDATPTEREVLGAIRYQANLATLHTDERLLPPLPRAWAAWNYHRAAGPTDGDGATVTYLLNRLQRLPTRHQVCVTLNRDDEIRTEQVVARMRYAHPVFDLAATRAQTRHREISGVGRTSFCGAYWGHGFHEDGLQSAVKVCEALGVGNPLR